MLTVIHSIATDVALLNFSKASLLWTSALPQAWASTKSQTFLAPLTAHSKNQLTTERNTYCQTAPSCCLFIHPHLLPLLSLSLSLSHTHTHTHTHTNTQTQIHTQLLLTSSFHVKEISFSVPFWDMLRTCVQSILPIAISSFQPFNCVWLCQSPSPAARDSTWKEGLCQWVMMQPLNFLELRIYFKFKIFFYTFTKSLGQRFAIISSPSSRFLISI